MLQKIVDYLYNKFVVKEAEYIEVYYIKANVACNNKNVFTTTFMDAFLPENNIFNNNTMYSVDGCLVFSIERKENHFRVYIPKMYEEALRILAEQFHVEVKIMNKE